MRFLLRERGTPGGYLAPRLAFRSALRCAFRYFFIALRCFFEAFFKSLFCCLAYFLAFSRELRAHSATPGLCAWDGAHHAKLKAASNVRRTIRFTEIPLRPNNLVSLHPPSSLESRNAQGVASSKPRYLSMGSTLGALPRQAAYIFARSSVLPRESTIWRKRSPLARVRPS
jgi:hypothetical protein